ncbi:uncharacterized protein PODANS_1_1170 [Podospora anserina S mat+]|uniref:Podospora anserina S mat+ genomic DNA chromosome 1, supercontig 1 n=1 Tax=Podospora anserina (strain S / ATCC MYA-4624 / DSM 980 / FGSC 10383) TaxID=515849 RepID=B2A9N3_PODAN|nr:uncharacterized protein PODANS_1_1170 [Podospora anserina S mat+]CAP59781.1 unnamed protein product [Podospora anserina S mat+]
MPLLLLARPRLLGIPAARTRHQHRREMLLRTHQHLHLLLGLGREWRLLVRWWPLPVSSPRSLDSETSSGHLFATCYFGQHTMIVCLAIYGIHSIIRSHVGIPFLHLISTTT